MSDRSSPSAVTSASAGSIRRRLLVLLLGGLLIAWGGMLAQGYEELREEVDELADTRLEQNARTLMRLDLSRLQALADAEPVREEDDHADRHEKYESDDEDEDAARPVGFEVWSSAGVLLLRTGATPQTGFDPRAGHGLWPIDDQRWHTFAVRHPQQGFQVRVFEEEATRSHLLRKLARRMAQWLLLTLPALAILIWAGTTWGLTPLATLSRAIGSRSASNLRPLDLARVPSEVRPLVESLNKLLDRLSDSLDRERSFTADAAHELRTPLAAIQVQAEVALAATSEAQRRNAIEQVIAGVQRTTRLTGQLLLLARLDHAETADLQPVDLGQAAADCAARYAELAESRKVVLEVTAENDCVVRADPVALTILIDNLLDNALKYGRAGGQVALRVARENAQIVLNVRDDGPGVAPEHRARLRDRFFRVPGSGVEGSGLGLALVERIARQYGGTLEIGPGLDGQGLGVTIRLPQQTGSNAPR